MNRISQFVGLLLFMVVAPLAMAQVQQTLEMQTGQGGPTGGGPSVAPQTVTMRLNTNNPTNGTTFAARTPAVTVTYSLSNQQYTGLTTGFPAGTGGNAVMFGAGTNTAFGNTSTTSFAIYTDIGAIAGASDPMYTSAGNSPAGSRINVGSNGGVELFVSARALAVQPAATRPPVNARVRMADLTLTFSQPVDNPILYFNDLGTFTTTQLGIATEFDLISGGTGLTRLSGNAVFSVSGMSINNSAVTPRTPCNTADASGCGSVRVDGTGIASLTLRVFLRGDGNSSTGNWDAPTISHSGDGWILGVALNPILDLQITKTNTTAAGPNDQANDTVTPGATTTYTLVVRNNGVDPVIGAVVRDTATAGLNCPGGNTVTVAGPAAALPTGGPFTVANLTGAGIALGTLNPATDVVTFTFSCTVAN